MRFWSAVAKVVLELNGIPAFRRAGCGAYRRVAQAAARVIASLRDVDGVYLTGSVTRPEFVVPGMSDIDLVAVAQIPTLESELRLRRQLRRAHRVLHASLPVFTNLDYLGVDDLEYVRAFPHAWALDLDTSWQCLAGRNRLRADAPSVPREQARLVRLAQCIKRWGKAHPHLVEATERERYTRVQTERLLIQALAAWQDRGRLTPLDVLLADAGRTHTHPALGSLQSGAPRTIERMASASLEIVDRLAAEACRCWSSTWPRASRAQVVPVDSAVRHAADCLLGAGFSCVAVAPPGLCDPAAVLLAIGGDAIPPRELLRRARVAHSSMSQTPRTPLRAAGRLVVWTRSVCQAAALAPTIPFVGSALASGALQTFGSELPVVRCPPPEVMDATLRTRVITSFTRPLVRPVRAPAEWDRMVAFAHHTLRPSMARAQDRGEFELGAFPDSTARVDERELVCVWRQWLAERKRVLDRSRPD